MDTLNSLTRNTFFSIVTSLLSRVGNTLLFIVILNRLGTDEGGVYNLALAFFFIASRFAFWGLDHLLTREVAKDRSKAGLYLSNFLFARAILSLITITLFGLIVIALNYAPSTELIIILMLLSVFPENINNLCWSCYAAFEQYQLTSIGAVANVIFKLGLGILLIFLGADLALVIIVILVGHTIAMFINLSLVKRRYMPSGWQRPDPDFIKVQMRIAIPFIFVGMFFILDNRLDNILLSFFSTESEIGVYGAAMAVIVALSLIPQGYRIAILPVMARYQQNEPTSLHSLYDRSYKYLLALAIPLATATFIMADEIIDLIYREDLEGAVLALRILAVAIVLIYLNILNSRLLIVHNRQDLIAKFLLVALSVNLLANVLLMPSFGSTGAAIARTLSLLTIFLLSSWAANSFVDSVGKFNYLWRFLVSASIMGLVVWLLAPYGIWLQVIAGIFVYGLLILLTRAISSDEIHFLRSLVRRSTSEA